MWIEPLMWTIIGAVMGSFYNVVIYRLPRKIPLSNPRYSFCTSCGKPVEWYDNIPILSYFLLKGKCRHCGEKISPRYPIVEVLTATLFLMGSIEYGYPEKLLYMAVISSLIIIAFVDLEFYVILDTCVAILAIAGITWKWLDGELMQALLTGGVVLGFTFLLARFSRGLGYGDVKLMGAMGTLLGPYGFIFALFTASVVGAITAGVLIALGKIDLKSKIPFGPFLAMGTVLSLHFSKKFFSFLTGGV